MADGRAQVRLQDILDEIEGIRSVTMGLSFVEFDRSWAAVRATQHALLMISEAVKNLPADVKARRPEIPWGRIQALGNFLRHEYAAIDNDRIWSIVVDHLPALEYAPSLGRQARAPDARRRVIPGGVRRRGSAPLAALRSAR